MTNGQNVAKAKHLEDVANGAKRYILAEILDVTQAVATELENIGGASYSTFETGKSGLVPAPTANDQNKFLRGNGTWSTIEDSIDYVIGSRVSTVEGGLWRDSINDVPVLKLRHGDYEYNFNYDSITSLGGESIAIATVTPDTYVLGTDSVSAEGGLWYELSDNVPTLNLHAGSFKYGFNYDSITYKGGNSHLVSYLPFDSSTTADACGNEWTLSGSNLSISTEAKKFGTGSLFSGGSPDYIAANDILDCSSEKWTFDFWFYGRSPKAAVGGLQINRSLEVTYRNKSDQVTPLLGGTSVTLADGQWYHFALVKDGDTWYSFLNGTCIQTKSVDSSTIKFDNVFQIAGDAYANTWYDNVRIFKDVALWTENFTPPTAADYA